jgi:hypothetical protein
MFTKLFIEHIYKTTKGRTMKLTTIALVFTLSITSVAAQAQDSIQHSGQASKHSVLAVGHGALSTAKIASAVVAVPLVVAGSVALTAGAASIQTGASIADSSSKHHHHGPLVITETTITADPTPNKVIVIQKKQTVVQSY